MGVQDYTIKALNLHNEYRARHGAPALQWSHELRKLASDYASHLASRNDFGQDGKLRAKPNISWGQNLYEVKGSSCSDVEAVERAIESWYEDIAKFNWQHPGLSGLAFSQLVWRSTGQVGVGVGRNKDNGRVVVVAFYNSPGNLRGDFSINVLPANLKGKGRQNKTQQSLPVIKATWVN